MFPTRWLRSAFARRHNSARPRPARRLSVEPLEDRATPSTGGLLDPTFGSDGHVLGSFAGNSDRAFAVVTQSDGKIIAAGDAFSTRTQSDFLVARYNANGTLDPTFGGGGYAATDFKRLNDTIFAVAVQADGKIVAAGRVNGSQSGSSDFGLVRYNANGTLDTTFGNKGKVTTDLSASGEQINTVLIDSAGRVLVGGYTTNAAGQNVAALARYTARGALDTTFGNGGKLVTGVRLTIGYGADQVALQADGKIVVAGNVGDAATNTGKFVVARFNSDGTPDASFGGGGSVATQVGHTDNFGGLTIDPDGRILVAGWESSLAVANPRPFYLLRYNADGTPDAGFGAGGAEALARTPGQWSLGSGRLVAGVAVQADGRVVVGGKMYDLTGQQWHDVAVRVDSSGAVDTGYGDGGWADTQLASADDAWGMALQPDGRLLLAGDTHPSASGPADLTLIRFLASAPQVGSFTATPNPVTADSPFTLTAGGVTDGNAGAAVTRVSFYLRNADGTETLLGNGTPNADGTWALTLPDGLPTGSYTLLAQATDSYGAIGDPLALDLQVN